MVVFLLQVTKRSLRSRQRQASADIKTGLSTRRTAQCDDGESSSGIVALRGLVGDGVFQTVRSVDLGETRVSVLAPLQGLTNLSDLRLSGTQVSDLTPLQELLNLRE